MTEVWEIKLNDNDTPKSARLLAECLADAIDECDYLIVNSVARHLDRYAALLERSGVFLEQIVDVADYPDGTSHGITLSEVMEQRQVHINEVIQQLRAHANNLLRDRLRWGYDDYDITLLRKAADLFERSAGKWVKVTERLPEESETRRWYCLSSIGEEMWLRRIEGNWWQGSLPAVLRADVIWWLDARLPTSGGE